MRNTMLLALLSAPLLAAGCGAKKSSKNLDDEVTGRVFEENLEDGTIRQEIDLDGDGTINIVNVYRPTDSVGRLPIAKKVDLNLDGRMDVFTEFTPEGGMKVERIDTDFNGKVDWIDFYQDGSRVKAEIDSNFDGEMDIFCYYRRMPDGTTTIERKERDTSGDGQIDMWERFDEQGQVIRTGRDTNGDGEMDERTE